MLREKQRDKEENLSATLTELDRDLMIIERQIEPENYLHSVLDVREFNDRAPSLDSPQSCFLL